MNIGTDNKNWGNIRVSSIKWQGKAPSNNAFEAFTDVVYGIRAMIVLLQTYTKRNLLTIRQLINTYAPPHENKTDAYIDFVAKNSGIGADVNFQKTKENLYKIIKAMVKIETNNNLPVSIFETAWKMTNTTFFDKFKIIASNSLPTALILLFVGSIIYLLKK